MKFAFRAALSLCLLASGVPAFAQQYSGSGASQQPAAYWLLVNASASGTVVRPQGGNYLFHISGTFGGSTVTLTENFGANSQTLGTYTSAPATDPCFAIPQGATVQATISGGAPSAMYATIGGADGGCGVSTSGGGGAVNLTGINGVTPLVGAGATGTGSLRTTQAQDTTTVAGAAPTTTGIYVTGPSAAALATSALQTTGNTSLATIATNSGNPIPAGTNIIGKTGIDQTTDGTTNAVHLVAGTAIAGKVGIDQTTDGTTNAVHLVAGTAIAGKVGIDQTTPGTTNAIQPIAGTTGGVTPFTLTAAASTNATNVKASAGTLYHIGVYNNSATLAWVSFYNTSGTPTCGTSIVYQTMIPANSTSGAGAVEDFTTGMAFSSGIGICVTTGIAGTGSVAATSYVVGLGYK